jgi:acid stress-induced BolA-like protein IbaG/YrbA
MNRLTKHLEVVIITDSSERLQRMNRRKQVYSYEGALVAASAVFLISLCVQLGLSILNLKGGI